MKTTPTPHFDVQLGTWVESPVKPTFNEKGEVTNKKEIVEAVFGKLLARFNNYLDVEDIAEDVLDIFTVSNVSKVEGLTACEQENLNDLIGS